MRNYILAAGLTVVAVLAYFYIAAPDPASPVTSVSAQGRGVALAEVIVPELTGNAVIGERVFNAKCATCHGENAAGTDGAGPPLVHKIYEPSHHGDLAFLAAAKNGVRPHHWKFGPMPPVEGVTDAEVAMVVDYVRALQRANGIR